MRKIQLLCCLVLVGCHSAPPPTALSTAFSAQYPARPTVPPPPFKVFHQTADTFTLVTKDNATDDEIEAIIWELRDAAHTHSEHKP